MSGPVDWRKGGEGDRTGQESSAAGQDVQGSGGQEPDRQGYGGEPHGAQFYGAQPYGAPAYGSQSYGGQAYGGQAYGSQPYDGRGYPAPTPGGHIPQVPPTNAGWAVASMIFFWPLAFVAFTASSNVVRLSMMGDHAGAQAASDQAKRLGKISLIIVAVLLVLYIVGIIVLIAAAASSVNTSTGVR